MIYSIIAFLLFVATNNSMPTNQRQALLDFYASTNGASWTCDQTGWSTNANDPCQTPRWPGILCYAGLVTALDLESCNLTGTILASLGYLTDLEGLLLGANNLSGNIPDIFGSLTDLLEIDLMYNQFSGPIPDSLGSLVNLQFLYLGFNQLNGTIPDSLGSLVNLQFLWLYDNQLSGSIPNSLGSMVNIKSLDLGSNQLNGTIPNSLGSLANLQGLSLYDNQLSGCIPNSLGSMVNINFLDLGSNQLNGTIPNSLGSLVNLYYLYLDSNNLNESIPDSLGNSTNLKELDLSFNQLSGSIPNSLGSLVHLQLLNLTSNQLYGQVSSSLCSNSLLTSCDVSANLGLYSLSNCSNCSFTPQRLNVIYNSITAYPGLALPITNASLLVTDRYSSNPVRYDFSQVSPSVGQFLISSSFVSSYNAIDVSLQRVLCQIPMNVMTGGTYNFTPITFDGAATTGLYPFQLNILNMTPPTILLNNIQYWNTGNVISLKSSISVIHTFASANQIFFDVSNATSMATFQYINGTNAISYFSQADVNLNSVAISLPLSFAGALSIPVTVYIGLNPYTIQLGIISAPTISQSLQVTTVNIVSMTPTITNATLINNSVFYLKGSSFNNGSSINYVQINNILCPIINLTINNLYCQYPIVINTSQQFNVKLFTLSTFAVWNTSFIYNYIYLTSSSPNISTASVSLPIILSSMFGSLTLAIVIICLYIVWRRRSNKVYKMDSESLALSEKSLLKTRWDNLNRTTLQFMNQFQTQSVENSALFIPVYRRITWSDNLRQSELIASGATGEIFRCEILSQNINPCFENIDPIVAVKMFCKDYNILSFHQEVAIMSKVSFCPYCVRLLGYVDNEKDHLAIVMPLYAHSLNDLLYNTCAFNVDPSVWKSIFCDVVKGVLAMHSIQIAHLDLKPTNIMIEAFGKATNHYTAVIGDFGLSKSFSATSIKGWREAKAKGFSLPYCDPQTLSRFRCGTFNMMKETVQEAFDRDLYALGIIGWEIISRKKPWQDMNAEQIFIAVVQNSQRPQWHSKADADWKYVVELLWPLVGRAPLTDVLQILEGAK